MGNYMGESKPTVAAVFDTAPSNSVIGNVEAVVMNFMWYLFQTARVQLVAQEAHDQGITFAGALQKG
jgi:hypothetical protein